MNGEEEEGKTKKLRNKTSVLCGTDVKGRQRGNFIVPFFCVKCEGGKVTARVREERCFGC